MALSTMAAELMRKIKTRFFSGWKKLTFVVWLHVIDDHFPTLYFNIFDIENYLQQNTA